MLRHPNPDHLISWCFYHAHVQPNSGICKRFYRGKPLCGAEIALQLAPIFAMRQAYRARDPFGAAPFLFILAGYGIYRPPCA